MDALYKSTFTLLLYFTSPFLSLPSLPVEVGPPWLWLGDLGERYKLPKQVRGEPGRQTYSGAFSAYLPCAVQTYLFFSNRNSRFRPASSPWKPSPPAIIMLLGENDIADGCTVNDKHVQLSRQHVRIYYTVMGKSKSRFDLNRY